MGLTKLFQNSAYMDREVKNLRKNVPHKESGGSSIHVIVNAHVNLRVIFSSRCS
jgi:hypothetical protein